MAPCRGAIRPSGRRVNCDAGLSQVEEGAAESISVARILAVDDSPSMRTLVKVTLSDAGHEVEQAEDGVQALQKAQGGSYDLVLADVNMPNMDGITLTAELRKLDPYKRTPILILTTEVSDAQKQKGRAAGATGWLTKPFNPNKLLATISRVI